MGAVNSALDKYAALSSVMKLNKLTEVLAAKLGGIFTEVGTLFGPLLGVFLKLP